jgi:hypothetical protein
MIPGVASSNAVDLVRSIEALSEMLKSAQVREMNMTDKLLKAGIQQAVQDSQLGTIIDLLA